MSKGQKLVTKLKRRQRSVREATEASVGMDKRPEVMQNSPKAQGLMRGAQRRYDDSFGFNAVGHKPEVEFKVVASSLDRYDFDTDSGTDFGMRLVMAGVAGIAEETEITTVADNTGSLNDTYFLINTPENQYYVWYNVNAAGTDPALANKTGVEVAIATDATADDVAAATATELDGLADMSASDASDVITATNSKAGAVADAADTGVTGFGFSVTTQGTNATGSLLGASGAQPGDSVQIQEGALEGRMLEVVEVIDSSTLRLDDVSTFTTPESDVACRFIISGSKKSYV